VQALHDINLEVSDGEFVAFLGPSGCGKTTLLKIIEGLVSASNGSVELDGVALRGVSHKLAFVFQDVCLLPWRSVLQNVALGPEAQHVPKQERERRARNALELVGLAERANDPPYTLSGGMEQRVGVARALAVDPQILLMDEPFGHLDRITRETLQAEIAELTTKLKTTTLFVTHDVDEAIFLSDRIAIFGTNPGGIVKIIDVDLPKPRSQVAIWDDPQARAIRAEVLEQLVLDRQRV
jgi:NitT/TauT family transport system ATP-binding protein